MLTIEAIAKIAYNAKVAVLAYEVTLTPVPEGVEQTGLPALWDDLPAEHPDRPWAMTTAQNEIDNGPTDLHTIETFINAHRSQENFTADQAAFLMTVHTLKPMLSGRITTVGG